MKRKSFLRHEFWPTWLFYLPCFLYGFFLSIKARSFTYLTTVNPCLRYSGAFAYSKHQALTLFDEKVLPKMVLIGKEDKHEDKLEKIDSQGIQLPLIVKPDEGERGKGVEIITKEEELKEYFAYCPQGNYIIQEYITYPLELGVFYYVDPETGIPTVSSITSKEFFSVCGDGQRTISELVGTNPRIVHRRQYLSKKFGNKWHTVPPAGEVILVEPIGSHSRGTEFRDASRHINSRIESFFTELAKPVHGFYYGRFDIRVKNWEYLEQGKSVRLLEVNGVNSEPTHIYDSSLTYFQTQREAFRYMKILYRIARKNMKNGVKPTALYPTIKDLCNHLKKQKRSF